jgi:hypothetical protein
MEGEFTHLTITSAAHMFHCVGALAIWYSAGIIDSSYVLPDVGRNCQGAEQERREPVASVRMTTGSLLLGRRVISLD